jgi:hypothetical protein
LLIEFLPCRICMTQAVTVGSSLLSTITMLAQTIPGRNWHHQNLRLMEAN